MIENKEIKVICKKKYLSCFFSVHMDISIPWDKCFGGNSAEPRNPPNTVIPEDRNVDSHLKPMKDTSIPHLYYCTNHL